MPRMSILTASEKEAFESPPVFNAAERKRFFDTPPRIEDTLRGLRTPTNQVWFLLMLGYFKATKRFYRTQFHGGDLQFVARRMGYFPEMVDPKSLDEATYRRYRGEILTYLGFKPFGKGVGRELAQHLQPMVRSQARSKFMLMRAVDFLEQQKTEVPTLQALSDIILAEVGRHRLALNRCVEQSLSHQGRALLEDLLGRPGDGDPECQKFQRYRLTLLKRISQSLRVKKIRSAVDDLLTLRDLFEEVAPTVELLDLSNEGIRFYASSVAKSRIFQVSRRHEEDRYLHLVCFIAHQYQRSQDTLIDVFLQSVQTSVNACRRQHKDAYYEGRAAHRRSLRDFAVSVSSYALSPLSEIESIAFASDILDSEKVEQIQSVLRCKERQRRRVGEEVQQFEQQTKNELGDGEFLGLLETGSLKLQNRVAEIAKHVQFEGCPHLITAIEHFREKNAVIGQNPPVGFLTAEERCAVTDDSGQLRVSLYKALLFLKMSEALKAGNLNVPHSLRYRSLDDYLIPAERWRSEADALIHQADLTPLAESDIVLAGLNETLGRQYERTNQSLVSGDNEPIQFRKDGSFIVCTPRSDTDDNDRSHSVFPENRYIPLLEVLATVQRATGFVDEFQHWQTKYNRPKPSDNTFFAGVIGYGCHIGLRKIARISKLINESELDNTVNWYFSLENLHAVNDRLVRFLDQLPLPNLYRQDATRLHTSSDGQKYEVSVDSLNANYSFKYFGQGRGVSSYNFIDERHLLFYSTVISSAEREAAYVIDGLLHNEVIKSDIHSTDTHGYTEVLFGVMHLLGITYAPRIKNLKEQRIYAFPSQRRRHYQDRDYRILPDGYINTGLIEENWQDILRFVATIKLKVTTASQLFKRLNSYSKQHPLYRALKEFGKIIKSLFVLQYVDSVELRQSIERQLNKAESSNRFSRAVCFGNGQEFLQGEKSEQEVAECCRRLIKNAVVCWNYLYLSQRLLDERDDERRQDLISAIRGGSVVAWQHINLHGEYDFSTEKLQDSVGLEVPKIRQLVVG